MSVLKGLKDFKAEKQRLEDQAAERERPKIAYFNWKNNKNKEDKDVVYVRFLQEFDSGVEGFREDRGLPVMSVEHQAPGPVGYLYRANCTLESEGRCYACERNKEDRADMKATGRKESKGWGQRRNFYIWALVDYSDGAGPVPVVLSRSFGSSFVEDLITEVEEDDENRITNKMWKVTRSGSGTTTKWSLRLAKGVDLYDDTDVVVPALEETALRSISYEDQPAYYGKGSGEVAAEPAAPVQARKAPEESGELVW